MILKGSGRVDLVSFSQLYDDDMLRKKYLSWLDNIDVVKLVASPELLLPKTNNFVDLSFERFNRQNCKGFFIREKETQKYIGTAKLDSICFYKKSAEDGILIGDIDFWGKGIANDVYVVLLDYAFSVLGLKRVSSGCNEHNLGMIKVLERIGYVREGVRRRADYISGKYSDHYFYGILREEYLPSS